MPAIILKSHFIADVLFAILQILGKLWVRFRVQSLQIMYYHCDVCFHFYIISYPMGTKFRNLIKK